MTAARETSKRAAGSGSYRRRSVRRLSRERRGLATLWLIVAGPALMTLLIFVADVANIWLARVELENALESAALAGVKEWGDAGFPDTQAARTVAVSYANANTIVGTPLVITDNYDNGGGANQNGPQTGNLIFAAVTSASSPYNLNAGIVGSCGGGGNGGAVIAQSTAPVPSLADSLFGVPLGPYSVQSQATARYNCSNNQPELIRVGTLTYPGP
jgi:Flp pilus assembly protein TadG